MNAIEQTKVTAHLGKIIATSTTYLFIIYHLIQSSTISSNV